MSESTSKALHALPEYSTLFVELFFAVAIGAGVIELHTYLFPPDLRSPSFWAIVSVYFAATTSWIGWHTSTSSYPYTTSRAGHIRSVLDGITVATYVALMWFAKETPASFLGQSPQERSWLAWYLWGFVVVFVLYLIIGLARRAEHHDPRASQVPKIVGHGGALLVVAVFYGATSRWFPTLLTNLAPYALWIVLASPFVAMASYRYFREWRQLSWIPTRKRTTLAIDVDGVLAEQVVPVLGRLNRQRGLNLVKSDITAWDLPIQETNIKDEIESALRCEDFVKNMLPMPGMLDALGALAEKHDIVVATNREDIAIPWSEDWLQNHGVPYRRVISTRVSGKKIPEADILVDDYVGNIKTFLESGPSDRWAILFAQPWNTDLSSLSTFVASGRVRIAHSWAAIPLLLRS